MAESFVKTMKRDCASWMPKPDTRTALQNLAIAFDHYNESPPTARRASFVGKQILQPKRDRVSGYAGASPRTQNDIADV